MNANFSPIRTDKLETLRRENHSLRMQLANAEARERKSWAPAANLRDLVNVHLANQAALDACANHTVTNVDPVAFKRAERAAELSYSDLVVAVEDAFLVPADTLRKALS